jgi:hypothetical protein
VLSDRLAYALYHSTSDNEGLVLQSNFFEWDVLGSMDQVAKGQGLPSGDGPFYGMDVDRAASPPTLFVCTDSNVYSSRDQGDSWQLASTGLPRRPHCTALRAVAHANGQGFLYLSTFGRSAWRATLA